MLGRVLSIITVFTMLGLLLLGWYFVELLTMPVLVVAWLGVVAAGAAIVWFTWDRYERAQNSRAARKLAEAEVDVKRAEAEKIRRDSDIYVVTAKIDEQVHLLDRKTGYWRAAHSDPRTYANGPQGRSLPNEEELATWYAWQQSHSRRVVETVQPVAQLAAPQLDPVLPRLVEAQRLIIAGGSDAGKSTLVKHIIAGRADHSKIIVIDPHGKSDLLGYPVIGAGRDYEAIGEALRSLVWLMTARYSDVKCGAFNYGQHERVSVFVDEWTSIAQKVDGAGAALKTLLVESRKINIHLAIITHSTTVETLGIDAQIRKSATVVELMGGNGNPRRVFIHPSTKLAPDGGKARPVEYALPGPFQGYVKPGAEVVLELPDARILQAQQMHLDGASLTAVTRTFFDTQNPNGRQINEVRAILDRATQARQSREKPATA